MSTVNEAHGRLTPSQLLGSFRAVSSLYPYQPSLSLWRSWEHAAYRKHDLPEPVLDLGCGDSRFFQLLWPRKLGVVGIDRDPVALASAQRAGVYSSVCRSDAYSLPFTKNSFGSVFSNCVLEHLADPLPVLQQVHTFLRPGGTFLFSIITKQLIDWFAPPWDTPNAKADQKAQEDKELWTSFHSIARALSERGWSEALETSGFLVEKITPILPENSARLFLHLDVLCHTPTDNGEVAPLLTRYLKKQNNFPEAYARIVEGLCIMDQEESSFGGAVFLARKPS